MAEQSRFELLPQGSKPCVLPLHHCSKKKHSQPTLLTESIEPKYQIKKVSIAHCEHTFFTLSTKRRYKNIKTYV